MEEDNNKCIEAECIPPAWSQVW